MITRMDPSVSSGCFGAHVRRDALETFCPSHWPAPTQSLLGQPPCLILRPAPNDTPSRPFPTASAGYQLQLQKLGPVGGSN